MKAIVYTESETIEERIKDLEKRARKNNNIICTCAKNNKVIFKEIDTLDKELIKLAN